MAIGWKTRAGIVLSAIWLIVAYVVGDSGDRLSTFLLLGAMPLVVVWGVVWAVAGWRAQRPAVLAADAAEIAKQKRHSRWVLVGSLAIIGLGLLAASVQATKAGHDGSVAYYFGQWIVWGLVAAIPLRFFSKRFPGIVSIGAALVVGVGLNWSVYSQAREERTIRESLARATPIFAKMQTAAVEDEEIKRAQVGIFEPALLAQAAVSRELMGLGLEFQKTIESLQLETIFSPPILATEAGRAQSRLIIGQWNEAAKALNSGQTAALARARARMLAAVAQMPESNRASFLDGFERGSARLDSFVKNFHELQREGIQASTDLVDLLDKNQGQFELFKGPPPNLLFRTDALLQEYRRMFKRVADVAEREQSLRSQFQAAQSGTMIELGNLVSDRKR